MNTEQLITKLQCEPQITQPSKALKLDSSLHNEIGSLIISERRERLQTTMEKQAQYILPPSDQINLLL